MKRYGAFDLLHRLMDMAVEHRHRAETPDQAERLRCIIGSPAPGLRDCPQRDVGKQHDRGGGRFALQIVRKPRQLLGAKRSHPARLEVRHIDQANEMHAVLVERIPAAPLGVDSLAIALQVGLAEVGIDDVVFAGNVEGIEPRLTDGLIGVVKFVRLGQMCDITGVKHEGGLLRQPADLGNRLLERRHRIGVRRRFETDVAVGNLQERETACGLRVSLRNSEQQR